MAAWEIGTIVALSSEAHLNFFVSNFRISPAVIFYPVLMMSFGIETALFPTAFITFLCVFLFRSVLLCLQGIFSAPLAIELLPGACFYITYALFFCLFTRSKHHIPLKQIILSTFFCDLLSNIIEVIFRSQLTSAPFPSSGAVSKLAAIALIRSVLVCILVSYARWYHSLLAKEEHEKRYQRLFLLTTSLKSETYLMKKNSDEIEKVMGDAYHLYEECAKQDIPHSIQQMVLTIASEIHDIKKDYIRIIQGIEKEIGKNPDNSEMSFHDLLQILLESARTNSEQKNISILFEEHVSYPFRTKDHYALMSVLNNIVNNAIEALESTGRKGIISIREELQDDTILISVEDNGPGISPRHMRSIFEIGYSTKFDQETGNIFRGVGLYGVRQLVENHFGGTIEVRSEENRKTVFILKLPCSRVSV